MNQMQAQAMERVGELADPIFRTPCSVCGNAEAQHGTYPTCSSHPYTPDENCRHVIGARCIGAECNSKGCIRGAKAAIAAATEGAV